MNIQQNKEIAIKEIPAQIKYMEFNDGIVKIVNSENQNNYNLNLEANRMLKEIKEENIENNENFKVEENNENVFNNNMSINTSNEQYYLNEIYNNNNNNNNMNENEMRYSIKEELEEKVFKEKYINGPNIKIIKYKIEKFDEDNFNNFITMNNQKRNNNEFINERQGLKMQKMIRKTYNNNFNQNNNEFNEGINPNKIYNYEINMNNNKKIINKNEYENNNIEISNEDQSIYIQDKSLRYNKNLNDSNNIYKSPGIVKEKRNYQLVSSNYSKSGKNAYISKNYIGSEKTTFMEKKIEENKNINKDKDIKKQEIIIEIKDETKEQKEKAFCNTKIMNAISFENYNDNIDNKESKIMNQKNIEGIQIINQNEIQTFKPNPDIIRNENNKEMNKYNNINQYNSKNMNNELSFKLENRNVGNEQKAIKKKKKKIIYYRRHKPIEIQHFDVQIIQNQQEFTNNRNYHGNIMNNENINYKNNIIKENIIKEENKVPPVQSLYQNINNFNNHKLIRLNPPQEELIYNRNRYYDNNSIPSYPYYKEEVINYKYRIPHTPNPRQTLINITPMRTINEPSSPYIYNMERPYKNYNRYYKTEIFEGFKPLTPPNPPKINQTEFENYERYFNNEYNNNDMRRRNLYPKRKEPLIIYNEEEYNNDNNFPHYQYNNGQRFIRNNYRKERKKNIFNYNKKNFFL